MRAQVVLTPVESKKLIAQAVAKLDTVRRASHDGIIVMHPSSSTYFIVEELTGHKPTTNVWVCGMVIPKGTCIEMGMSATIESRPEGTIRGGGKDFRHSWVIKNGELTSGIPLGSLLAEMGPDDVYIKGVNAIDVQGRVGVLLGGRKGGSIVSVMAAQREQGFSIIFPVGLEKLIPVPIEESAREASQRALDYSMGMGCNLLPCEGTVVTEVKAIDILCGAIATPIAAGGLGGAEGAVVLVVKGEEQQVSTAINYIEQAKGARLPSMRTSSCHDCFHKSCSFPVGDKHWV